MRSQSHIKENNGGVMHYQLPGKESAEGKFPGGMLA